MSVPASLMVENAAQIEDLRDRLARVRAVLKSLYNIEANRTAAPFSFAMLMTNDSIPLDSFEQNTFTTRDTGVVFTEAQELDIQMYKYAIGALMEAIEALRDAYDIRVPFEELAVKKESNWHPAVKHSRLGGFRDGDTPRSPLPGWSPKARADLSPR